MSQFQTIVKKKNRNGVGYNKRFQESGPDVVSTPCNVHVPLNLQQQGFPFSNPLTFEAKCLKNPLTFEAKCLKKGSVEHDATWQTRIQFICYSSVLGKLIATTAPWILMDPPGYQVSILSLHVWWPCIHFLWQIEHILVSQRQHATCLWQITSVVREALV